MIIALSVLYFTLEPSPAVAPTPTSVAPVEIPPNTEPDMNPDSARIGDPDTDPTETPTPIGKLKADTFTGTLTEVNTGCFSDGECSVTVDGKHVTVLMGWSRNTVGTIIGAPSIGDLESYIGKPVEVYAQDNSDGTYTLYGSEGFYVKVLEPGA